jgi:hypothetical protein
MEAMLSDTILAKKYFYVYLNKLFVLGDKLEAIAAFIDLPG